MKYLKTYEILNTPFKIGDYVKINVLDLRLRMYHIIKIIDIDERAEKYVLEILLKNENFKILNNKIISIYSEKLERLATPEEIKEYEILKTSSKYNL